MKRLVDKVAIITGGANGMGAADAKKFIEEGAKVMITDVDENRGQELAKILGENATFMKHDVSKAADWEKVVTQTEELFGNIDILVNNAGVAGLWQPMAEMTEEEYKRVISIDQVGTFLGMKAVINSMKVAGSGSIINVSSNAGMIGIPNIIAYTSAKWAIRGMTKVAAKELAADHIRVNAILPGVIDTEFGKADATPEQEAGLGAEIESIPLKRRGTPEEVANLTVFLASDNSTYCTGADFLIDGGVTQ